ncbi:MAG TPA: thymidine kinase [Bacilli bacterium]|nr:thymidine kinase [Bacilli bacterium]
MAKLYFRYGAMNCGKSTALLQVAHNYKEKDRTIVLLKPSIDKKGDNCVVSRIGIKREVDYLITPEESIIEVIKDRLNELDCILVDEVQFMKEKQIDDLFLITKHYDIPVICYGLRNDFRTELFEGSKRLFELADEYQEMETICSCGKKARFNARMVNGEYTDVGDQVVIDGTASVIYEPLCGKCYLEKVKKLEIDKPKVKKL